MTSQTMERTQTLLISKNSLLFCSRRFIKISFRFPLNSLGSLGHWNPNKHNRPLIWRQKLKLPFCPTDFLKILCSRFRLQPRSPSYGVSVRDPVELRRFPGGGRRPQHLLLHAAVRRAEVVAGAPRQAGDRWGDIKFIKKLNETRFQWQLVQWSLYPESQTTKTSRLQGNSLSCSFPFV